MRITEISTYRLGKWLNRPIPTVRYFTKFITNRLTLYHDKVRGSTSTPPKKKTLRKLSLRKRALPYQVKKRDVILNMNEIRRELTLDFLELGNVDFNQLVAKHNQQRTASVFTLSRDFLCRLKRILETLSVSGSG